ncbi:MAG: adenylosuccinate synthase [Candidatus Diapherotrites archaeon]|uniref:Adenylosuccinate synthetase n=1 Tax=Candidatus Iainarchaeum sp. TaxID=3101447 RepID=A0A8T4LIU4_9ARCH|nr:adenylosuccinate synthase [Candidatus Diapherotrites archaeon]
MPGTVVIGAQFGDEGKGKITDFLAEKADYVVRFGGGNNAGHTVVVEGKQFKLHLLPSGVVHGKRCLIGAGVVVDPRTLMEELAALEREGIQADLGIDPRAHIILPYHNLLDAAGEEGNHHEKIGTTKKGIGPCYADKALRQGIRFEDLIEPNRLKEKLARNYPIKKKVLEQIYGIRVPFTEESLFKEYAAVGEKLRAYNVDVSLETCTALDQGKKVLFEGAQGTFLDNDFGTYPFVTSSHPISSGAAVGVGIPTGKIGKVVGIVKAYTTRVGEGPFPTELRDAFGEALRKKGNEFGTTTGRPRRVGWLDLPMLRTAQRLNGFTELAVMKLDVLAGLDELKVCTHYLVNGKEICFFPYSTKGVELAQPQYKAFKGFKDLNPKAKKLAQLPKEARTYLKFVEKEVGARISIVSIGPGREETVQA